MLKASLFGLLSLAVLFTGCVGTPSSTKITLKVMRNGKPVAGARTVFQRESDQVENGSGVSDANGVIASADTSTNLMATFANTAGNVQNLYTMRDLPPGAAVDVNLPPLTGAIVGIVAINTPSPFLNADFYTVAVLGNDSTFPTPIFPNALPANAPVVITVNENQVNANGKVTLIAVAANLSKGETVVAYAILKDITFATVGPTTAAIDFGAWKTDVRSLALRLTDMPAEFKIQGLFGTMGQFTDGLSFSEQGYAAPASLSMLPADLSLAVIPGISDEYSITASIEDITNHMEYRLNRRTATLTSLSSWSPVGTGLPPISLLKLDDLSTAAAPHLKWTQTGSAVTSAQAAMLTVKWRVSDGFALWSMLASPAALNAHNYQFPILPAAYADLIPPPGTLFLNAELYYVNNSTVSDYDSFMEQVNFSFRSSTLKKGQTGEQNVVYTIGTP